MTRIRIGLVLTMITAAMFSAVSLLNSLRDFGIGIAVASAAVIAYGLVDFIDSRNQEYMRQGREAVWARREGS